MRRSMRNVHHRPQVEDSLANLAGCGPGEQLTGWQHAGIIAAVFFGITFLVPPILWLIIWTIQQILSLRSPQTMCSWVYDYWTYWLGNL